MALLGVGEEVDEGRHVVVHHQGKIGLGGSQIGLRLGHKVRIDLEGYVRCDVGRSFLFLRCKAVAALEGFHLETVHLVEDAVELVLQRRRVLDVDTAQQHQVHGAIELHLGFCQPALAIVRLAPGVRLLHLLDNDAHVLLLARGLLGTGRGGLRRCFLQRGRGRLRILIGRCFHGRSWSAARQPYGQHGTARAEKRPSTLTRLTAQPLR